MARIRDKCFLTSGLAMIICKARGQSKIQGTNATKIKSTNAIEAHQAHRSPQGSLTHWNPWGLLANQNPSGPPAYRIPMRSTGVPKLTMPTDTLKSMGPISARSLRGSSKLVKQLKLSEPIKLKPIRPTKIHQATKAHGAYQSLRDLPKLVKPLKPAWPTKGSQATAETYGID